MVAKIKKQDVQTSIFGGYHKIVVALLLIGTFITFSNALKNDFLINWDDDGYILNNQQVRSENPNESKLTFDNIKEICTSFHFGNYHPLTTISYVIEYHFFKLNPKPYILNNILLHLLNILLVFICVYQLTAHHYSAYFIAALFAIHPMHVESVVWISERKDVLYTFFFLASLITFVQFFKNNKTYYFVLALLFFLLSLLSKSAAVVLPVILTLYLYCFKKESNLKKYISLLPFYALSLMFGVIALYSQDATSQQLTPDLNYFERFLAAHYALSFYVIKFILPINLSAFHPHPNLSEGIPLTYYIAPLFFWLFVFITSKAIKSFTKSLWSWGLFIVPLMLVIQIIPVGGAIVAERYTYLPYIGLSFLLSYILQKYSSFNHIVKPISIVIILLFAFQTHSRTSVWNNGYTLFTDVIKKYPESFYAYHSRGIIHHYAGDYNKALADYSKAIQLNPNYGLTYYNRGLTYNMFQKFKEAEVDYGKAIDLMPEHDNSFNDRAIARLNQNKITEAIEDFTTALSINAHNERAYYNRGIAFLKIADLENACTDFAHADDMGLIQARDLFQKYCLDIKPVKNKRFSLNN